MKNSFLLYLLLVLSLCSLISANDVLEDIKDDLEEISEKIEDFVEDNVQNYTEQIETFSKKYLYEIIGCYLILFYILFFQMGKKNNIVILNMFQDATKEVWESNFSHVGVGNRGDSTLFYQESGSSYRYYASGRVNTPFALVQFNLKKRHDLIYHWLLDFVWPEKDRIIIDLPINSSSQPICCAIVRKRELKTIRESLFDLKSLTKQVFLEGVNTKMNIVLAENEESASALFDSNVLSTVNQYEKLIHSIHITDQKTFSNFDLHLRATINLPVNKKDFSDIAVIVRMLLYLLDRVSRYQLTNKMSQQALKERSKIDEQKSKEDEERRKEELQKKKYDKKQEELAKISDPAKRERIEEKERKKEEKKRFQKKFMKIQ